MPTIRCTFYTNDLSAITLLIGKHRPVLIYIPSHLEKIWKLKWDFYGYHPLSFKISIVYLRTLKSEPNFTIVYVTL